MTLFIEMPLFVIFRQGTSEFSRILTAKTQGSTIYTPSSPNRLHNGAHRDSEISNSIGPLDVVSSDTAVTNDTLYVVLGSVLGGLTILVVLLVALYHCRQRSAERGNYRILKKPQSNQ